MPSKDDIYIFMKANKGARFRVIHLANLFEMLRARMGDKLTSMYRNRVFYPGLDREQVKKTAENSREFLCYVYFVK